MTRINPDPLRYRAHWLLTPGEAYCQLMLIAQAMNEEEFAGYCLGYAGHGTWVDGPFYVRFPAQHAAIAFFGEQCTFAGQQVQFRDWPLKAMHIAAAARERSRMLVQRDCQGFFIATAIEGDYIHQLDADTSVGVSGREGLDQRVWEHIPHVMGIGSLHELSLANRAMTAQAGDRAPSTRGAAVTSPWRTAAAVRANHAQSPQRADGRAGDAASRDVSFGRRGQPSSTQCDAFPERGSSVVSGTCRSKIVTGVCWYSPESRIRCQSKG